MKKWWVALALGLALTVTGDARAVIGTIDNVPSATLLFPYFEVDLANANGVTTRLQIQNASATAILAHVTIYSDLSVPVTLFNVYLTGYDTQEIDLGSFIRTGAYPQTASAGQDPTDAVSHKGTWSQDINFASCSGQLPAGPLPATPLAGMQQLLIGNIYNGVCAGVNHADQIARGYVTVDTVNNCTARTPRDAGYFGSGGSGDATNQNLMLGQFAMINPSTNFVQGSAAVHIEASPGIGVFGGDYPTGDPITTTPGNYTFYGKYDSPAWTAADNREPLATNWAIPFTDRRSDIIYWRDPKVSQTYFTCPATYGVRPSWYPLSGEAGFGGTPNAGVTLFDMQEQPFFLTPPAPGLPPPPTPPLPFGTAAGRSRIGNDVQTPYFVNVPLKEGWMYLDMNTSVAAAGSVPPFDPAASQAVFLDFSFPEGLTGDDTLSTTSMPTALDSASVPTHSHP